MIWDFKDARLYIHFIFYCRTWHKIDTFNGEKPLTDSLQGLLFNDDEQIDDGRVTRIYNAEEDAIFVEITQIQNSSNIKKS